MTHQPTRSPLRRFTLAVLLFVCVPAAEARADWLFGGFVGTTFGAETAFLDLEVGAATSKHLLFGGNGGWLSDHIFGIEAELSFVPGFFEGGDPDRFEINQFPQVTGSSVVTLFGNVIAALPISVTRESLRPFLIGGVGLLDVNIDEPVGLLPSDTSPAMQLGGGALGFITERAGLRFDLRYIRSLDRTADDITLERRTKLSFWRATVGVAIRY